MASKLKEFLSTLNDEELEMVDEWKSMQDPERIKDWSEETIIATIAPGITWAYRSKAEEEDDPKKADSYVMRRKELFRIWKRRGLFA